LIAGTRDIYTYQGSAGEIIDIQVNAHQPADTITDANTQLQDQLLDTKVVLLSPDGSLLGENDDIADGQTNSALMGIELPGDGQYVIQIYNPVSSDVGGGYTLLVRPGVVPPVTEATETP
jgi:hypothetical protein